jgi:hypothetical protein
MARSTLKVAPKSGAGPASAKSRGMKKKNLSLTDVSLNTIEDLKSSTDAATAAEIVRRALAFYSMAVQRQKAGDRIVFRGPDGTDTAVVIL